MSIENNLNLIESPDRLKLTYTSPILDLDDSLVSEFALGIFEEFRLPTPAILEENADNLRNHVNHLPTRIDSIYPTPFEEIDTYRSDNEEIYYYRKDQAEEIGGYHSDNESLYYAQESLREANDHQFFFNDSREILDEIERAKNEPATLFNILDWVGDQQNKILFNAVKENRASIIPILIENCDIDITSHDREGNTLMHLAYNNRSYAIMEILLHYFSMSIIYLKNGAGRSVFNEMVLRDESNLLDWMREVTHLNEQERS